MKSSCSDARIGGVYSSSCSRHRVNLVLTTAAFYGNAVQHRSDRSERLLLPSFVKALVSSDEQDDGDHHFCVNLRRLAGVHRGASAALTLHGLEGRMGAINTSSGYSSSEYDVSSSDRACGKIGAGSSGARGRSSRNHGNAGRPAHWQQIIAAHRCKEEKRVEMAQSMGRSNTRNDAS